MNQHTSATIDAIFQYRAQRKATVQTDTSSTNMVQDDLLWSLEPNQIKL